MKFFAFSIFPLSCFRIHYRAFFHERIPQFYPIWIIASAATKISLATRNAAKTEEGARARARYVHRTFLPLLVRPRCAASDQRLHRDPPFVAAEKKSTKPLRAQSEYRFAASRFRAGRCHTRRRGAMRRTRTPRASAAAASCAASFAIFIKHCDFA